MFQPENVIWQSENGTWNLGFYDAYTSGTDVEDVKFEYESLDRFMYVSSNHSSPEEAEISWLGTNLGDDGLIIYYDETTLEEINRLEELRSEYLAERAEKKKPLLTV